MGKISGRRHQPGHLSGQPACIFWKLCGREWLNVSCCQESPYGRVSVSCFGTVDVPANNTLGIRHGRIPNYYSREDFIATADSLVSLRLWMLVSIASTVRNGRPPLQLRRWILHIEIDYHFENTIYRGGVYNGFGCPNSCIHVPKGPNIKTGLIFLR